MSRNKVERAGIGCLVLVVGVTILLSIGWMVMMSLTNQAVETRQALDDTYPSQETFTPDFAGTIPADRIERFLAVRRVLMPHCDRFSEYRDAFGGMDELENAEEEPAPGDALDRIRGVGSVLWEMGRTVGEYAITRNRTLMENGMGLGEYTWIYVITYYSWLGNRPVDLVKTSEARAKVFHGRVLEEVKAMIARHVADVEASDTPMGRLAPWLAELDSLNRSEDRTPFQDGLPLELRESLEPFRAELAQVFCSATGELEIMRTVRTGAWYDHR
jgi:hypothetical protein